MCVHVASAFDVINLNDAGPGSLREAIGLANNIISGPSNPNLIVFKVSGTVNLNSSLPVVLRHTTIVGHAFGNTINGKGTFRLLYNFPNRKLLIDNIKFTNGNAANGGVIENVGLLTFENCTFENNTSTGNGGVVYNSSVVTYIDCLFKNNVANGDGGAIYNNAAVSIVKSSTFTGNSAGANGGAIGGTASYIERSTIFSNTATISGGGVHYSPSSHDVIINSTIINNSCGSSNLGGGVFVDDIEFTNTIVANNLANGVAHDVHAVSGTVSQTTSIVKVSTGVAPTWTSSSDPDLGSALNCGINIKFPPNSGSPAIGTGTSGSLTTDICGVAYGSMDIGSASDASPSTFYVNNLNDAGPESFRQAILDANSTGGSFAQLPHTIIFTVSGKVDLITLLPTVANHVKINAHSGGNTINRTGSAKYRLLFINASMFVEINGFSFTNGDIVGDGGAIYNNGYLTINNCAFSNNTASNFGGAIFQVYNNNYSRRLEVNKCTFTSNDANVGGAFGARGNCHIFTSTFEGNSALNGNGGAIVADGAPNSIVNCTIINNTSTGEGGGVSANDISVVNTIVANNKKNGTDNDFYVGTSVTQSNSIVEVSTGNTITWLSNDDPDLGSATTCGAHKKFIPNCGSYAINNGTSIDAPAEDVCGTTYGMMDIGSAAYNPSPTPKIYWVSSLADAGTGSLRMVIDSMNQNCGSSIDSLHTINFKVSGVVELVSALPKINNHVAIIAHGSGNSINRNDTTTEYSLLEIKPNKTVKIDGVKFTNGDGPAGGGAIINTGNLTVVNCVFENNNASQGGAILSSELTFIASLKVDNCVFMNNTAIYQGGAIASDIIEVKNSTFLDNYCQNSIGALLAMSSSSIVNCTFKGNKSDLAGGLYLNGPSSIINSTIIENVDSSGSLAGGLIAGSDMAIINCIIANNTSNGAAADFMNSGSGTITQSSSIVMSSSGAGLPIWSSTADPLLGGPTTCGIQTKFIPGNGSYAIDNGSTTGAPLNDICGVAYGVMDIGSVAIASGIVTAQDGNWHSPATWIGGVVPVGTDSVKIKHNINVTATTGKVKIDKIIVDNKDGQALLSINNSDSLIVARDIIVEGASATNAAKIAVSGTSIVKANNLDLDNTISGSTVELELNGNGKVILLEDLNMDAQAAGEAVLDMNDGSNLILKGNVVRPNDFGKSEMEQGASISYNGTSAQTFTSYDLGAGDLFGHANVEIDNAAGLVMEAGKGGALLTDTLTFVSGKITTVTGDQVIFSGSRTYAKDATDANHISGPAKKIGAGSFTFPTGKDGRVGKIGISDPGATGDFTGEYFRGLPSDTSNHVSSIKRISSKEYWDLSRNTGAASVFVTLHWVRADSAGISDLSDLIVCHYSGGQWKDETQSTTTGGIDHYSGSITTANALTSFSPFTFGSSSSGANPLPIELGDFKVVKVDEQTANVHWVTLTEINTDYFEVQRSTDGIHFTAIGTVKAEGNSNSIVNYNYVDKDLNSLQVNQVYYRLKGVDFDGTETFSRIEVLELTSGLKTGLITSLSPNPFQNIIKLNLNPRISGDIKVVVTDVLGSISLERVLSQEHSSTHHLDLGNLPNGVYLVSILTNGEKETVKMVKE